MEAKTQSEWDLDLEAIALTRQAHMLAERGTNWDAQARTYAILALERRLAWLGERITNGLDT